MEVWFLLHIDNTDNHYYYTLIFNLQCVFKVQQSRQLCHLLWNLRGPLLPYTDLDYLPHL
jgi:hypothetical protein